MENLVDPFERSYLSTALALIRRKVIHALGPVMGEHYDISGVRMEEYKIGIDRALVDWG